MLAALLLILTPRYYGHAFNNPKDIPFAVFYLWSITYLVRNLESLPRLPRGMIWKTGLAIGFALGIRVGGLVLFGYLGLFYAVGYALQVERWNDQKAIAGLARTFLLQMVSVLAIAYGTMLIFWPWAQLNPVLHPFEALKTFSHFPYFAITFFEGASMGSTKIPRHYLLKWLLLGLPEFVFTGLVLGAICLTVSALKSGQSGLRKLQYSLVVFSVLFPVGQAVLTRMPL